jgi:hypothetical protein
MVAWTSLDYNSKLKLRKWWKKRMEMNEGDDDDEGEDEERRRSIGEIAEQGLLENEGRVLDDNVLRFMKHLHKRERDRGIIQQGKNNNNQLAGV